MDKLKAVLKIKKMQEGLALGLVGLLVVLYCAAQQAVFGGALWQSPFLFAGMGGLALLALGLALLRQALPELAAVTEHPLAPPPASNYRQLLLMLALSVGYFWLMPVVGFLLSTALYLVALLWLLGERSWLLLLAISFCTSAVVYLIFGVLLGVVLP